MREHFDRFAAEHERGDAMAAVRSHTIRSQPLIRDIDDRPVGMLMLNLKGRASTPAACAAW